MSPSSQVPTSERSQLRHQLRAQLLANPNFFGTFPTGGEEPVVEIAGDTHWEELTCVGFNPVLRQLEAVVSIRQASGYSGGLCTPGSTEYVRFFLDSGSGFHDVGLASVAVHDLPDPAGGSSHPVDYLVSLLLDAGTLERCCTTPVLPTVRAILSWNVVPSTSPASVPVWGNVLDARIQLAPSQEKCWEGVLGSAAIEKNAGFLAGSGITAADLAKVKASDPPVPVPWHRLVGPYREHGVPDHRLVFPVIGPMLAGQPAPAASSQPDLAAAAAIGIDVGAAVAALGDGSGDTDYEQLGCIGLSPSTDTLGAVVHVKRPLGYGGDLCRPGSQEIVAFWADWDNDDIFDTYLGTVSVPVHDIPGIPPEGLWYAVRLPVNVGDHLRGCELPNVVKIRAVLSWATPPSTVDPEAVPFWGDRLDAFVQLRPGHAAGLYELIYDVGGVLVPDISPATFLAYPSSGSISPSPCPAPASDRPFGGQVRIGGRIYGSGPPGTVHFQVQYATYGTSAWAPVTHQTTFVLAHPDPSDPLYPFQTVDLIEPDGWFPYLEDWTVSPPVLEASDLLAVWNSSSVSDGSYSLRLAYTEDYPITAASAISYSQPVTIVVDNKPFVVSPTANITVDTASTLDLVIDGGDCHSYVGGPDGETISGHLRALHDQFWFWALDLEPSTHTHGAAPTPACRSFTSLVDNGDGAAAWTLSTKDLDTCGYTLTLRAWDRTIVDSNGAIEHSASKAVGFSVT